MSYFAEAVRLPSAKLPNIGDTVVGKVIEMNRSTVPEFDAKGRPSGLLFDDNGDPVQQVDVTLETETGKVVLHTHGAIFYAIGRALAEAGSDDLAIGDTLSVSYTGDGEVTAKGRNAPKQYEATITKG